MINTLKTRISSSSLSLFTTGIGILIVYLALRPIYFDIITPYYKTITFMWPLFPFINVNVLKHAIGYLNFGTLIFGILVALKSKWPLPPIGYLLCALPIFGFHTTYYQDDTLLLLIIVVLLSLTPLASKSTLISYWHMGQFKLLFSIILFWRVMAYLTTGWISSLSGGDSSLTFLGISIVIIELIFILIPWKYPQTLPIFWIYLGSPLMTYLNTAPSIHGTTMLLLLFLLSTLFFKPTYPIWIVTTIQNTLKSQQSSIKNAEDTYTPSPKTVKWTSYAISLYLIVQISLPLLIQLYSSQSEITRWTHGHLEFAWAMKSESVRVSGYYTLHHPHTKALIDTIPLSDVSRKAQAQAYSILGYAHQLRDAKETQFSFKPDVHAHLYKSINGRPMAQYTDPTVSLSDQKFHFTKTPPWIIPPPKDYFTKPNPLHK